MTKLKIKTETVWLGDCGPIKDLKEFDRLVKSEKYADRIGYLVNELNRSRAIPQSSEIVAQARKVASVLSQKNQVVTWGLDDSGFPAYMGCSWCCKNGCLAVITFDKVPRFYFCKSVLGYYSETHDFVAEGEENVLIAIDHYSEED